MSDRCRLPNPHKTAAIACPVIRTRPFILTRTQTIHRQQSSLEAFEAADTSAVESENEELKQA